MVRPVRRSDSPIITLFTGRFSAENNAHNLVMDRTIFEVKNQQKLTKFSKQKYSFDYNKRDLITIN